MADNYVLSTPDLEEFEKDFKWILDYHVDLPIENELNQNFETFNRATRNARDELSVLLERGLDANSEAVSRLLGWVALPQNLPDASAWGKAAYETAATLGIMEAALRKKMASLGALIDAVQKEPNLRPGPDLFGRRVTELRTLFMPAITSKKTKVR
jgi:hypothetical protein